MDATVGGKGTHSLCSQYSHLAAARAPSQWPMNGMSSLGIVTKGRIMSRSSCSRMWQRYVKRPATLRHALSTSLVTASHRTARVVIPFVAEYGYWSAASSCSPIAAANWERVVI
jgi:hypothetical protein